MADEQLNRLQAALADRYAVQRELGSGGMATVYLAEDLKHHRKVAVKVLRPELAAVLGGERFLSGRLPGCTQRHKTTLNDTLTAIWKALTRDRIYAEYPSGTLRTGTIPGQSPA